MRGKTTSIPADLLSEAGELVSGWTGLHFPATRLRDLERGLGVAVRDLGFEDLEAGIRWLVSSTPTKATIEVLAAHLTVGETYFFRDRKCFDFLQERILPELLGRRRDAGRYVRMWSAGCCSGEEAYSLAILLSMMMPDQSGWDVSIVGTDINAAFLQKASAATYGDWSFRETQAWVKEIFFASTGANRYLLRPDIKKRVTFTYHNLIDITPLALSGSSMDLILCRNVLMYLTPAHQEAVVRKLGAHLAEGGWLIVSPSEVSNGLFREFETVSFKGAVFYRKEPAGSREKPCPPVDITPAHRFYSHLSMDQAHYRPNVGKAIDPAVRAAASPEREGTESDRADPYDEALLLYEKGLCAEAIEKLTPLAERGHRKGSAAALLSRILANQGRLSEAIGFCEKAIASERAEAAHYHLRALIHQEQGRPREAVADLRRALYLDRKFAPAHLLLGSIAVGEGKRNESARHFKNALELLRDRPPDEVVPWTEGITASRLMEIIESAGLEDIA